MGLAQLKPQRDIQRGPRKTYNDNTQHTKNQKGVSEPQLDFFPLIPVFNDKNLRPWQIYKLFQDNSLACLWTGGSDLVTAFKTSYVPAIPNPS